MQTLIDDGLFIKSYRLLPEEDGAIHALSAREIVDSCIEECIEYQVLRDLQADYSGPKDSDHASSDGHNSYLFTHNQFMQAIKQQNQIPLEKNSVLIPETERSPIISTLEQSA